MPDWIRHLHQSRRARDMTFAAIGVLTLGSTGGALLANYTVAGMTTVAAAPPPRPYQVAAVDADPEWMRDVAMEASGAGDARY